MIRVYYLPVTTVSGTDTVAGNDIIHDALLECTDQPDVRKLIMDTTPTEHDALLAAGAVPAPASPGDIAQYNDQVIIYPPSPDVVRAQQLLATSPAAITQPEMWELMRIFGRLLGVPD